MATSATTRPFPAIRGGAFAAAAYAVGAVLLAIEAGVHIQQFAAFYEGVRWIGLLFVLNAAGCALVIAGLVRARTRALAGFGGIAISAVALGGLALSYAHGLFGWQEFGLRTPVAIALVAEVGAVVALAAALALSTRG